MKIIHSFEELYALPGESLAVAIGTFDGLHLGHRRVVDAVVAAARAHSCPAVLLSFDRHPLHVIQPAQAPGRLLRKQDRYGLLATFGIDVLLELAFSQQLAETSATEFLERLARGRSRLLFAAGRDFRFGRDQRGEGALPTRTGDGVRIESVIVEDLSSEGDKISSTRIRHLLEQGQVADAARLLGRPYQVLGYRCQGRNVGTGIGYPTVNLHHIETMLPCDGVYKTRTGIGRNWWRSMTYLGTRPTFGEQSHCVETHLFDFGETVREGTAVIVEFLDWIRGDRRFETIAELQARLQQDKDAALG